MCRIAKDGRRVLIACAVHVHVSMNKQIFRYENFQACFRCENFQACLGVKIFRPV